MKIAVPFENGEVFQHFGHAEAFKIYEVEEGKIVSSEVVKTEGSGHEAVANFLAGLEVAGVVCGNIGDAAKDALAYAGVGYCSGAEGDADAAVEALLRGELQDAGAGCDGGCEGGCGGGCGGCGGGCHSMPAIEGKNVGKTVKAHYRGTFNDGTEFDSSYGRGEPLEFVCGAGMMIRGFDVAVANMEVGETVKIHLMPEEAYGEADPNAIFTLQLAQLPGAETLTAGDQVVLYDAMDRPVPVKVVSKDDTTITFDANHEMAGKELNFEIELVEVQ